MKTVERLADLLSAHQKKLEILAIFLLFCTVSVRFKGRNTQWLWNNYSWIAMLLALAILIIAIIWIRIEKQKTAGLLAEIRKETQKKPFDPSVLSARQREVFDLIVQGKSNKEIMDILSIELSTLKTHINKIYKAFDIRSRRQIRGQASKD